MTISQPSQPESNTHLSRTALIIADNLSILLADKDSGVSGNIDPDASFSSFGLDSLLMVEMIAKLENELGITLEPELAFNYPTVRSLARFIDETQDGEIQKCTTIA